MSRSDPRWLQRHLRDPYVKQANAGGWRSRAVFKLQEIDRKYHLFKPGATVVDLGAAPGSWSQYAARQVGEHGRVLALDLLPLSPMPRVTVLQGDFREPEIETALVAALDGRGVDVLISDMAPNLSGIKSADQARSAHLVELTLDFAEHWLSATAPCLVKVFQGAELADLRRRMARQFAEVIAIKPEASRSESAELFLLGLNAIR